ncbi:hypothetical protein GGH94_003701 [Coemansia aciculifera]|uniref:GLTSCR protein conserved domain-containing protein n=1 Tax=Coemansia aciculifera TaxID=417176 RepID=A0A9W8IGM1_9FUNG|nr:hypothetical protein GGH94_003701 [Coemansia aciculifera]KAJ2872993.1 hypothetical protein GGH93_003584 [Coemansia aciculifera]
MSPGPANTDKKPHVPVVTSATKSTQNGSGSTVTSAAVSRAGSRTTSPSALTPSKSIGPLLSSTATPPPPTNSASAARPPRPSTPGAPMAAQLLRRIAVAGVTVEVVRQDSTIIYRLPGNMPVSSLTPEQRARVMQEIQRLRDSSQANSGRTTPATPPPSQQQAGLTRIQSNARSTQGTAQQRPPLMPRSSTLPGTPRSASSATPPRAIQTHASAATGGFLPTRTGTYPSAPTTPTSASTPRQQRTLAPGFAPIRPHSTTLAQSPASAVPKSDLEKMYESAYLKLLSGPADVLRKLSPPIELSSIVKKTSVNGSYGASDDVIDPNILLEILKALTKAQASQLAGMYDLDVKAGKDPLEIGTRGFRSSAPSSQMSSREGSPTAGCMSGTELDSSLDIPGSGAATPTGKRKYTKSGKYSTKKQPAVLTPTSPAEPPKRIPGSGTPIPPYPMYAHPDVNRMGCEPLTKRRARLYQANHEAEVSRRFREALAMDHQLVQTPDWRTPFNGPRDVVQRLLPFHVFQYSDSAIESGIKNEDDKAVKSATGLARRLQALSTRYDAILANEGSDRYYNMQHILLDRQRASQAKNELTALRDMRLQRDVAAMMPACSQSNAMDTD